jgi:predicted nucleic acid-binding protein
MGLSELTEPCFVDANIFLFTIWSDDLYGLSCKEFLNRVEAGELKGCTSVIVLDEVFHRLMLTELYTQFSILPRKASSTIHNQPELLSKLGTCFEDVIALHQISHLTILPIDGELQKRAVQLSQKYQLLPHDALHTACCEKMEIDHIATLDCDFERVDFLTVWTPEEKTDDEPSET